MPLAIMARIVAAVLISTVVPGAGARAAAAAAAPPTKSPRSNAVTAWGSATDQGPPEGQRFAASLVGIARSGAPASDGYWVAAADGGVFSYGTAPFLGSAAGRPLAAPIVSIAATPAGDGYWLAAADGGVFSFGRAPFHGSLGSVALNAPIVAIAADPAGDGYWLAAADGGVFSFGRAPFHGSLGSVALNAPIVDMAADPAGDGYWLAAADGGVFSFGRASFHGSMGDGGLPAPVVDMAASPDRLGYWVAGRDGQVYPFGVTDVGSPAETAPSAPTVGLAAHSADGYWLVTGRRPILAARDRGPDVRRLQERLAELGYWVGPVDGLYGPLTEQAVYAFQKVEGLPVTGEATTDVRAALVGASRPLARGAGDGIEVDRARQVLFVVRSGAVVYAFNTSTGTEEPYIYEGRRYLADTPEGRWEINWQVNGYRTSNLGRLYRPKYFHPDGIAVHGYSFVPPYPASHGCVRVMNRAIDSLWAQDLAPMGSAVWVYGMTPPR